MRALSEWDERMHETYPHWAEVELVACLFLGVAGGIAVALVLGWLRIG